MYFNKISSNASPNKKFAKFNPDRQPTKEYGPINIEFIGGVGFTISCDTEENANRVIDLLNTYKRAQKQEHIFLNFEAGSSPKKEAITIKGDQNEILSAFSNLNLISSEQLKKYLFAEKNTIENKKSFPIQEIEKNGTFTAKISLGKKNR